MKVLVVGKGGREHALAWKLSLSPRAKAIFCAPGNPGTAAFATNVPIASDDIKGLVEFAKAEKIGLTVVGPEDSLALGIVDAFKKEGLPIFGPSKLAATLESSKAFAKTVMHDANVPTADFKICDHPDQAKTWISTRRYPLVVKADGLAAGKGVIVCSTQDEALKAVERIMVKEEFGRTAGRQIVLEKRMVGQELSVLAIVSGRTIIPLEPCQDHKAIFDNDLGPNTGGMGAYCPAPLGTKEILDQIDTEVLVPTVHAMKRRRMPFHGILYAGIMVTGQGARVLEFNCRMGDPETQPLMMRLQTDLLDLLEAAVENRLDEFEGKIAWDPRPAVCVVLAAKGYPGAVDKNHTITGLHEAAKLKDVQIFHGATKFDSRNIVTDGGRVLSVTALGDDMIAARAKAYEAVNLIKFSGMQYRTDIGLKALAPLPFPIKEITPEVVEEPVTEPEV
jgi:phosphoribosylamine--glycine ligase